ncbi:hypothetical protein ABDK56_03520 [Sphingomonas sp. ASV193]|uniref:hypothetical protein n=1 Tax=Sphingomonas sp. ASV193 TaxID=3144405 RepID=UPI0032E88E7C
MDFVRNPGVAERALDLFVIAIAMAAGGGCALLLAASPAAVALWAAIGGAAAALAMNVAGRAKQRPARSFGLDYAWPALDEAEDDTLLLDDPLPAAPSDSRVVRLFAPETLAVPGELAERIERWLGEARDRGVGEARVVSSERRDDEPAKAGPASAAFHAALTDLRRSLR